MKATDPSPRSAALALMRGVAEGQRHSELTAGNDGPLARLSPPRRAEAQRLAADTLRYRGRADATIRAHAEKMPKPAVLAVLRLMVCAHFVAGTPPHAAVAEAVRLVRADRHNHRAAGFVNAVMRRICDAGPAAWEAAGPTALPDALRARVLADWGATTTEAIEAAHERGAPLDLTPRDPAGRDQLRAAGAVALPSGSLRMVRGPAVSALPGYAEGAFWVQDAAAALPAALMGDVRGRRVLDLCAAPGGKTLQLAAAGADVTAVDISGPRLGRLRENLERTGLRARVVTADALTFEDAPFDAILVDAPCTATGTIRRHPDLPLLWDDAQPRALARLQRRLVGRARHLLKPGGRLVVATCALLKAEGEDLRAAILGRYDDLRPAADAVPAQWPREWHADAGAIRTLPSMWPDRGGLDGFFAAAFDRVG